MAGADETAELRALQAKAYGREGGLTPEEAVRLDELVRARSATARAEVVAEPSGAVEWAAVEGREPARTPAEDLGDAADDGDTGSTVAGMDPDDADHGAEHATAPRRPSLRAALRRHVRAVAIAAVVLLAAGVGLGWLAFGRDAQSGVALTAEQRGWQDALVASGDYDSGSVRAAAVEEGAVVWWATKEGRARTCLILGTADVTVPSCDRTDTVRENGLFGTISLGDGDEEERREVNAQLLLTAAGDAAIAVSVYDFGPMGTGIVYANEAETEAAKRLVEQGFDPGSLWVAGYDGDVPIWTATQPENGWQCLIYERAPNESFVACDDPMTMQEEGRALMLDVLDPDSGRTTRYELASRNGPTFLTITRDGGVTGAGEN